MEGKLPKSEPRRSGKARAVRKGTWQLSPYYVNNISKDRQLLRIHRLLLCLPIFPTVRQTEWFGTFYVAFVLQSKQALAVCTRRCCKQALFTAEGFVRKQSNFFLRRILTYVAEPPHGGELSYSAGHHVSAGTERPKSSRWPP
jgi:hypothetical protein